MSGRALKGLHCGSVPRSPGSGRAAPLGNPPYEPNSILNAESSDESDRVSVGVGDRRQPHALVGVDDLCRVQAAPAHLGEVTFEVVDGEVQQARTSPLRIAED